MSRSIAATERNPFPGLRPFREDEEYLFFGRENQVDKMVDMLAANRFLAVVGTSGSGKSSLVNCGLRPALRRGLMAAAGTSWRMAQFRPGYDPIRAMARALAQKGVLFNSFDSQGLTLEEMIEATLRMSKLGLVDLYGQVCAGERDNLLVVVDQFEELFRFRKLESSETEKLYGAGEEAIAFVNLLLEAATAGGCPLYVVLTMRSDFLGDCAQFPGLPEAINASSYLVPRMTREERRSAISGPVGVGGAELSPVLLTRLVNDVGDNPDQLSILQHALNRTWAAWESHRTGQLDLDHYARIGTMAHALDQHAEEAYAELQSERRQKICQKIFKALTDRVTDSRGIRRPTKLGILCALSEASEVEVIEVIEVFRHPSRSFLMPPVPEALETNTIIDISHESLMRVWERLKQWADEEAQSARLYRRLSESAALHAAGKAGLWRDPELQVALDWSRKEQPTAHWAALHQGGFETATRFLAESEASRKQEIRDKEDRQRQDLEYEKTRALAEEQKLRLAIQNRSAQRLRRLAAGLAVMFLATLIVSFMAIKKTNEAGAARLAAERQRLTAEEQRHNAEKAAIEASAARDETRAALDSLEASLQRQNSVAPGVANPQPADGPRSRVYLQIVDEQDRGYAQNMARMLRDAGFIVPGIELVQRARGLKTSEVRYYKRTEEDEAKKILDVLNKRDPTAKLSYLGLENSTRVRARHFEVWLSKR